MNVVLVVFDTLRKDHIGAYGNDWIHTPNLDAFASEAMRFDRAFPEALPTLPFRRALHTGQRTFPFTNHRPLKGDFPFAAPGWGPIPEEQDTISELLGAAGYRTALFTDVYHQMKPSKNFHRGFDEWQWIRGQETDKYRSGPPLPDGTLEQVLPEHFPPIHQQTAFFEQYLKNVQSRRDEEEFFPAALFREASRWLTENVDANPFFLLVDSFDPHEPWEPPEMYRRLYDDSGDEVPHIIQSLYSTHEGVFTPEELKRCQANYAGNVTLVDRWFGHFMDTLRLTGQLDDTMVIVASDHGHNLGLGPAEKGLVSKQGHPLTRAVADLALLVRHPSGAGAGQTCDGFVTNTDTAATILAAAGVDGPTEGQDIWPAAIAGAPSHRDYVTIAWGTLITTITDEWWCNVTIWGEEPLLYRLEDDPDLLNNLAADHPDVVAELLQKAIDDAGGSIPDYFEEFRGHPGCTPYLTSRQQGLMLTDPWPAGNDVD